MVKELQSLALDVKVITEDNQEIPLKEFEDDDDSDVPDATLNINIEGREDTPPEEVYEESYEEGFEEEIEELPEDIDFEPDSFDIENDDLDLEDFDI